MRATNFARQNVREVHGAGVVPFEAVVTGDEVHVFFVEDGCPLEWCAWNIGGSEMIVLIEIETYRSMGVDMNDIPC